MIKQVLIQGPFTDEDVKQILETVRIIEQRRPDDLFMVSMPDYDLTEYEAKAKLNALFPRVDGKEPEVWVEKRQPSDEVKP
jgi:hypothetical protein